MDEKFNEFGEYFVKQVIDEIHDKNEEQQQLLTSVAMMQIDYDSSNEFDFAFKVVKHSSLLAGNAYFESIGQYIVQQWMGKWNQESIADTLKPGDCTPLKIDAGHPPPHIMIQLQRPISVTNISLFHYPLHLLPESAINSAPKEFQIFVQFYCLLFCCLF